MGGGRGGGAGEVSGCDKDKRVEVPEAIVGSTDGKCNLPTEGEYGVLLPMLAPPLPARGEVAGVMPPPARSGREGFFFFASPAAGVSALASNKVSSISHRRSSPRASAVTRQRKSRMKNICVTAGELWGIACGMENVLPDVGVAAAVACGGRPVAVRYVGWRKEGRGWALLPCTSV